MFSINPRRHELKTDAGESFDETFFINLCRFSFNYWFYKDSTFNADSFRRTNVDWLAFWMTRLVSGLRLPRSEHFCRNANIVIRSMIGTKWDSIMRRETRDAGKGCRIKLQIPSRRSRKHVTPAPFPCTFDESSSKQTQAIQSKRKQHLPGSRSLSKENQSSATASNMDSLTQTVVKQKKLCNWSPGISLFYLK